MIRLALRQFRLQGAIVVGLLAALAVTVLVTGKQLHDLYRTTVASCGSLHDCSTATTAFLRSDHFLQASLPPVVLVAPALIGVFFGAPLVAREIETGTFRLVWTQSVSRLRWLCTRLALVGLVAMAAAGILSLLVTWWFAPIDRLNLNRLSPAMFGVRGITPVGYAAFGFALGVALGVLIRRTIPAMALTLVGFLGARLAATYWVRPVLSSPRRIVTPLTMAGANPNSGGSGTGPPGSWVLSSQTIAGNGRIVGENGGIGQNGALGLHISNGGAVSIPAVGSCPGVHLPGGREGTAGTFAQAFNACARHLHLRDILTYQPASRYWPFQWYETAIFVALALVLVGACIWWLVLRDQRPSRKARSARADASRGEAASSVAETRGGAETPRVIGGEARVSSSTGRAAILPTRPSFLALVNARPLLSVLPRAPRFRLSSISPTARDR